MKLILKILFAPVIPALAFFTWLCTLVVNISATIMAFVAALCAIMGVIKICTGSVGNGIAGLVAAFILSPWGLPMVAAWIIAHLHFLRFWLKETIYK